MSAPEFSFDQLDDLSLAVSTTKRPKSFAAGRLGPLVELSSLQRLGHSCLPKLTDLRLTQRLQALLRVSEETCFRNTQASIQLTKVFWDRDDEPDQWMTLCRDLESRAITSGFDKSCARGLVAALREFVDNIHDHSEAAVTGLAGYAIASNDLEIVVADSGIGMLQSLRSSSEFRYLTDSGQALKIAIEDGKSRHGSLSGHGRGFRPLFQGLSNLASFLRIRSGDS